MGRLEPKHWALIAGFMAATFSVTAGLDHWGDVLHPAVASGIMIQFATLISAVFAGAPQNPNLDAYSNPGRRLTDPLLPSPPSTNVTDATRRSL